MDGDSPPFGKSSVGRGKWHSKRDAEHRIFDAHTSFACLVLQSAMELFQDIHRGFLSFYSEMGFFVPAAIL
jgi:hypothetical protein